MTTTQRHTEQFVDVDGISTQVLKGGSGAPLLVLHGGLGNPGWMPWHEALSEKYTVYAPSHPGYDKTARPDWVRNIGDVAHFYIGLIEVLGLKQPAVMGFSLGGWITAELAARCPEKLRGIVLVNAVGVKPKQGEIAEMLMVPPEETRKLAFHDINKAPELPELTPEEQSVQWSNREMLSRLSWVPYMHNPNLAQYLKFVSLSSLIVWGREDGLVPLSVGEVYHEALKGSTLHVIDQCGHSPQIEQPEQFLQATQGFLSKL